MVKNKQKGFSVIEIVIVLAVVAVLGAIGYLVYDAQTSKTEETNTSANVPSPSPAPTPDSTSDTKAETTEETATYKLTLPNGWGATTTAPNEYVGELATNVEASGSYHYYQDKDGNYVAVILDPVGRDFAANEAWTTTTTATGFVFASKTTCTAGDAFCTPTDANEYRIGIKTNGELGGHSYFFFAGNAKQKTNVDTEVYKTIVESLVVK